MRVSAPSRGNGAGTPAVGIGDQPHPAAAQAGNTASIGKDFLRGTQFHDAHAFVQSGFDFFDVSGHFLAGAAVGDGHAAVFPHEASGGTGAVHCGIPRPDDDGVGADARGLAPAYGGEERKLIQNPGGIFAGDAEGQAFLRAHRDIDGVVFLGQRVEQGGVHGRILMEPHAQLEDGVDVAAQAVSGQAEGGDRVARHAAEHRLFFVQVHLHALCGEKAGAGQPGRARPDDGGALPGLGGGNAGSGFGHFFGHEALDLADHERLVVIDAGTPALALMVAGHALNVRERIGGGDDPPRQLEIAPGHGVEIPGDVLFRRTARHAGRGGAVEARERAFCLDRNVGEPFLVVAAVLAEDSRRIADEVGETGIAGDRRSALLPFGYGVGPGLAHLGT